MAQALFSFPTLDAAQAASSGGKLVLIDFTASWCGPCQAMEKTTWRDPRILEWVRQHACAVQVDIDADQPTASRFGVQAVPTVIALKDGAEVDRFVGGKNGGDALKWLEGVLRGETELDRLKASAGESPMGRLQVAQHLAMSGHPAEAAEAYAWLWEHGAQVDPGFDGVRGSFLLGAIAELLESHPPSRPRFAALRDAGAPSPEGGVPFDWILLNRALGDDEATLGWFDDFKRTPRDAATLHRLAALMSELLEDRERWEDLALLYPDPMAALAEQRSLEEKFLSQDLPEEMADQRDLLREQFELLFRAFAAKLVRALNAADRTGEADQVAAEGRRLDPSSEMAAALRDAGA